MIIKFTGSPDETARDQLRQMVDDGRVGNFEVKFCEDCDTSLFSDETDLPVYRQARKEAREQTGHSKYAMAKVCMHTEDFIELQAHLGEMYSGSRYNKQRLLRDARADEDRLDGLKKAMRKGHTVPIPVVEVLADGSLKAFQEGRHRAVAAFDMGERCIPVYIAQEV